MLTGSANKIGTWTPVGTGTVTVNATTKAVTIVPAGDGTATTARQQIATEVGKTYWWTYELQTSIQTFRTAGTTAGGTNLVGSNASTVWETKLVITATTTSVWLDLTRTSTGTTTTGNHRFEEAPTGGALARRLNGRNRYFKLDAGAAGLRTSNSLQYVGGWFKFQYQPTALAYLLDWAIPDAALTGGTQRVRIFFDPTVPKMAASTGGSSGNGNRYMEDVHNGAPGADIWRYIGISLAADGAISCVYEGTIGGTTSGAAPDIGNYLTVMQFGSRNNTTPNAFAPAAYADWVWCAGFIPTNGQIAELMAGKRPADIAGFSPTFYWPLEGSTVTEASSPAGADLTAPDAVGTIIGPYYTVPVSEDILPILMF